MKKIANIAFAFLVETLGLPGLIKSAYKVLAYQMKFRIEFPENSRCHCIYRSDHFSPDIRGSALDVSGRDAV